MGISDAIFVISAVKRLYIFISTLIMTCYHLPLALLTGVTLDPLSLTCVVLTLNIGHDNMWD